jgi:hypothetical protein
MRRKWLGMMMLISKSFAEDNYLAVWSIVTI